MNTVGWIGLLVSHFAAIGFGVFATLFFLEPKQQPRRKSHEGTYTPEVIEWAKSIHEDTLTPAALAKRLMGK